MSRPWLPTDTRPYSKQVAMARTLVQVFVGLAATIREFALFCLELTGSRAKARGAEWRAPVRTGTPIFVMHEAAVAFENIAFRER